MTNFEKIQMAVDMVREVRDSIDEESLLRAFIDQQILNLENLKDWVRK